MTEKELKKLNRYQLLELLVVQTERADQLQERVEKLESKLQEQKIKFSKLGSIAEATVHVSKVFEASQKAADMYLEAARQQAKDIVEFAEYRAKCIIQEAEETVQEED